MKIQLFFIQHTYILKRISTSDHEIEPHPKRFKGFTSNPIREEKKLRSQSVVTRRKEEFKQTTNSDTFEYFKKNENPASNIYSTSTNNTYISPEISRSNDIASTIFNTQNITNTSTSMHCADYPPFNIIYNISEETCWIITIMHNIRANLALKNYIIRNLRNKNIKKGIESILNINGAPISKEQHNFVTQLYAPGINLWEQCGDERLFLESLLEVADLPQNTSKQFLLGRKTYLFKKLYNGKKSKYEIHINEKMPYLPYFYLNPTSLFSSNDYFNISHVFHNDIVNFHELIKNYYESEYLDSFPGFIVLDLSGFRNPVNNCVFNKGVIFEKHIYINIKEGLNEQKYSLTGISFVENLNGIKHCRSVIKINGNWYDTDYETEKYLNKNRIPCSILLIELIKSLNNNANEITVDYSSGDGRKLFGCLLFYEKIDYMQTKKTSLKH